MKSQHDIKIEWEKAKEQLLKIGKEASVMAKKGEKELVKLSKIGKLHIDSTADNLKKERLYYLIGKEYVQSLSNDGQSPALKKYVNELKAVESHQRSLIKQINKEQAQ